MLKDKDIITINAAIITGLFVLGGLVNVEGIIFVTAIGLLVFGTSSVLALVSSIFEIQLKARMKKNTSDNFPNEGSQSVEDVFPAATIIVSQVVMLAGFFAVGISLFGVLSNK